MNSQYLKFIQLIRTAPTNVIEKSFETDEEAIQYQKAFLRARSAFKKLNMPPYGTIEHAERLADINYVNRFTTKKLCRDGRFIIQLIKRR